MGDSPTEQIEPETDRHSGAAVPGRRASRRVVLSLLGLGVGLAALAVAVGAIGGGEGEGQGGPVAWAEQPRLLTPATLPSDRILSGRIRNTSLRRVRIEARDVRLETTGGERVEGTATFVASFLHGLYPPMREPGRLAESELRRTGRLAVIEPRETVPITLAWRLEEGESGPVRVDYGQGSLPLRR